jgi:ankyrin repeat protein
MSTKNEMLGQLIDAAVKDPAAAVLLVEKFPQLRDARWIHGETAIHFLAVEGYVDAVRLLGALGFDVNLTNEFGDPPLIDVATLGNHDVAEALLAAGADPNCQSPTRDNALHCAVHSGNVRLVQTLISAGADANYVTELGQTVRDALPEDPQIRTAIEWTLQNHN